MTGARVAGTIAGNALSIASALPTEVVAKTTGH